MAVLTRICGAAALVLIGLSQPVYADNLQLHEPEIKAGLLYNFLKYTQWPASSPAGASAQMVVCVFGEDPFGGYLQPMAGRSVNQKDIVLRTIHAVPETGACNLLFINANEQKQWPELFRFLNGKSVLTVSDFSGFVQSGGMIEFGQKDSHVSVDLNIDAVTSAKLQIHDRLLKLMNVIHSGAGKP